MKIKLVLDINKNLQAQLNAVVTGRQGDKASNTVNVFVVDGGVPYNLTGNTIFYEGLKPNDAYIRDSSGVKMINATQGNFEYTFRPETFGVAGIGKRSYFTIEQGGTVRASTQDFGLVTLADAMTGNTMSGPYISELEELINLAQWLVDDINSRWTDINTQLTQLQNKLNTMDVVKRSGDTMTGDLNIVDGKGVSFMEVGNPNVRKAYISSGGNVTSLFDSKSGGRVWWYDHATQIFTVDKATNLVKKTEAFYDYAQPNGDTININGQDLNTIQKTGLYGGNNLGNSPDGTTAFFYVEVVRYSDRNYVKQVATVLAGTRAFSWIRKMTGANAWSAWDRNALADDVVKKAGDTITGHMNFRGNVVQETSDSLVGVQSVIGGPAKKWAIAPKTNGSLEWDKEIAMDLNTGKVTVSGLATKKDGRAGLTLTSDATNADTGNPPSVIRRGNTVTVRFKISRNVGSSSSRVTTLPVDMRPIEYIEFNTISDSGSLVKITIGTGGGVDMYTTGQIVAFVATFVVD